jgi:mono/diheme cytochrome c family protein
MVPDLVFTDIKGASHKLSDLGGEAGIVIAMTSATCPVSKRYMPKLAALEKELRAQRIALLLVNPFASEAAADIQAQLSAAGVTATYAHDKDQSLATALGARATTEVFLLDAKRTVLYRGALDDQYGLTYNLDAPRANYLRDAVAAMRVNQLPRIAATEAPGCELGLADARNHAATEVTYHRDVERILQQNCVACHREKGIAPFGLDDLAEVKDRAKTIKRVISEGVMPPWSAAPLKEGNPWGNDRSLGARDKADLLAWLGSSNRPLGDAHEAPAKLVFPSEWSIGKPDLIVQLPQPVAVKADGFMPYQTVTAQTTLTEDKWVQAYEILPTDRSVVHHVLVNVHANGANAARGKQDGDSYWAVYVPGNGSQIYPQGFARKLPAGATVTFQIHYTPSGKAVQEQLRMGLVFARETPRFAVETAAVLKRDLDIPPGDGNHVETFERSVPTDLNVIGFMPHMHVRGKAFKYELISADGSVETLLDIPRYDFNWQLRYEYAQPRTIPRGSKIRITAAFDNSPGNQANPDSTKRVKWGQQTYEEMMIGFIEHFVPIPQGVAAK